MQWNKTKCTTNIQSMKIYMISFYEKTLLLYSFIKLANVRYSDYELIFCFSFSFNVNTFLMRILQNTPNLKREKKIIQKFNTKWIENDSNSKSKSDTNNQTKKQETYKNILTNKNSITIFKIPIFICKNRLINYVTTTKCLNNLKKKKKF